jgi:hypothetical protein
VAKKILLLLLILTAASVAQRRVDPKYIYHRVICVTPLTGAGSATDPFRPKYAPWPMPSQTPVALTPAKQRQTGIIAFSFVPSDDGRLAIAEFVAFDRSAFQPIFNDASITVFERGRVSNAVIQTALQKHRKDFNLERFGTVMP